MTAAQRDEILKLLMASVDREEECRAVVAECLGHLSLLSPEAILPTLKSALSSESVEERTAAVNALRHAVVEKEHPIDAHLPDNLPVFLERIGDDDRHVRRGSLQLLSAVAHSKPVLLGGGRLEAVIPALYQQTKIDQSLIRTVDLG